MIDGIDDHIRHSLVQAVDQIFCANFAVHGAGDKERSAQMDVLRLRVRFKSIPNNII